MYMFFFSKSSLCCIYYSSEDSAAVGSLLEAGVCMRVPFSRVTIKQPKKLQEKTEEVDIAGVRCSPLAACSCTCTCTYTCIQQTDGGYKSSRIA